MKIAVFDTHRYEQEAFQKANGRFRYALTFFEPRLTRQTAELSKGFDVVCSFVNDRLDADALASLHRLGVRLVALRSAGFNHVDLEAAANIQLPVVRVPEYSPHAVAEHTIALILTLNRKIHRAHTRVREGNFSLEGLMGFDLCGKTCGIVGTGRIGAVLARILGGFGCHLLAHDVRPNPTLTTELGLRYVELAELYAASDIVSLHVPLTPTTYHLVDAPALRQMKSGVMLVNTGRGALIDTKALIDALKTGHVGSAALDVYEEEEGIFFRDLSDRVLQDDVLARLLTFPNVLVTAHQAFLTVEAVSNIVETTLENVRAFELGQPLQNAVHFAQVVAPVSATRRA